LFEQARELPFGGGAAGRMGVADPDGDGKEDTLELVGLWWREVATFVGRLRVAFAVPVVGSILQVVQMYGTGTFYFLNVAWLFVATQHDSSCHFPLVGAIARVVTVRLSDRNTNVLFKHRCDVCEPQVQFMRTTGTAMKRASTGTTTQRSGRRQTASLY
jgi:hypothetical protein